ncbi:hypothetical protein ACOME3_009827 [Neoechinorhynchus agilis]
MGVTTKTFLATANIDYIFTWSHECQKIKVERLIGSNEIQYCCSIQPPFKEDFTLRSLTAHPFHSWLLIVCFDKSNDSDEIFFAELDNSNLSKPPIIRSTIVSNGTNKGQCVSKLDWLFRRVDGSKAFVALYKNKVLAIFDNALKLRYNISLESTAPSDLPSRNCTSLFNRIVDFDHSDELISIRKQGKYIPIYAIKNNGSIHCELVSHDFERFPIEYKYISTNRNIFRFPTAICVISSAPTIIAIAFSCQRTVTKIMHFMVTFPSDCESQTLDLKTLETITYRDRIKGLYKSGTECLGYYLCDQSGRICKITADWIHSLAPSSLIPKINRSTLTFVTFCGFSDPSKLVFLEHNKDLRISVTSEENNAVNVLRIPNNARTTENGNYNISTVQKDLLEKFPRGDEIRSSDDGFELDKIFREAERRIQAEIESLKLKMGNVEHLESIYKTEIDMNEFLKITKVDIRKKTQTARQLKGFLDMQIKMYTTVSQISGIIPKIEGVKALSEDVIDQIDEARSENNLTLGKWVFDMVEGIEKCQNEFKALVNQCIELEQKVNLLTD